MVFRSRSLVFVRSLVAAVLGIALSAQLVQAQLLIHCSEAGTAVEMQHDDHAGHHSATRGPGSDVQPAPDDQSSAGCDMRSMCATAPAVPELPDTIDAVPQAAPITAPGAAAPHDWALRPDFPPPRL